MEIRWNYGILRSVSFNLKAFLIRFVFIEGFENLTRTGRILELSFDFLRKRYSYVTSFLLLVTSHTLTINCLNFDNKLIVVSRYYWQSLSQKYYKSLHLFWGDCQAFNWFLSTSFSCFCLVLDSVLDDSGATFLSVFTFSFKLSSVSMFFQECLQEL